MLGYLVLKRKNVSYFIRRASFARMIYFVDLVIFCALNFCGQSYKASMGVNYDSTVVLTSKLVIFTTLDSLITIVEAL